MQARLLFQKSLGKTCFKRAATLKEAGQFLSKDSLGEDPARHSGAPRCFVPLYNGLPKDTTVCRTVRRAAEGYDGLPNDTAGCRTVQRSAEEHGELPNDMAACRRAQRAAERYKTLPNGTVNRRRVQRPAEGYGELPNGTVGCRRIRRAAVRAFTPDLHESKSGWGILFPSHQSTPSSSSMEQSGLGRPQIIQAGLSQCCPLGSECWLTSKIIKSGLRHVFHS